MKNDQGQDKPAGRPNPLAGFCLRLKTVMFFKHSVRRILLLSVLLGLVLPGLAARAQSQGAAAIVAPDYSKFPAMSMLLDTFDGQGQFVAGLTPGNVVVLENGQQLQPDSVQELPLPVSLVVAINSSAILGVRDSFGISRYDTMANVISNWAAARPASSKDDVSLAWNGGVVASHFPPTDWKQRFDNFDPALRKSQSGLAALSFALDAAVDAQTVPGEKKAILFISGHLDTNSIGGLKELTDRAKQAGVRIYVWLADSQAFLSTPGAISLEQLALATDGRWLTFTGSETLPDPEEWLSPLRHIYQLTYTSKIRTAGDQALSMQINTKDLTLTTQTDSFKLDVEPPNPALLSPPTSITRQNPDKPFDIESFLPVQQEISILVEFPDGHTRKLVRTTLYVDGKKMAENTAEPFDKFSWGLGGYVASGEHDLEVEAQDELGLIHRSAPVPILVTVMQPPGGLFGLLARNSISVTISIVLVAGLVALGIILLGGRLRLSTLAERRRAQARKNDPVTQPVVAGIEAPHTARSAPFPWLRRKGVTPTAYFVKLTAEGQPSSGDPIGLTGHEMTFGTDPTQASQLLDDPSISALHARLRMQESGGFQLIDQNSIAGTWVNFEAIPKEGQNLKHGDVVHFGQLTYRFVLSKPPSTIKPTITPHQDG